MPKTATKKGARRSRLPEGMHLTRGSLETPHFTPEMLLRFLTNQLEKVDAELRSLGFEPEGPIVFTQAPTFQDILATNALVRRHDRLKRALADVPTMTHRERQYFIDGWCINPVEEAEIDLHFSRIQLRKARNLKQSAAADRRSDYAKLMTNEMKENPSLGPYAAARRIINAGLAKCSDQTLVNSVKPPQKRSKF